MKVYILFTETPYDPIIIGVYLNEKEARDRIETDADLHFPYIDEHEVIE